MARDEKRRPVEQAPKESRAVLPISPPKAKRIKLDDDYSSIFKNTTSSSKHDFLTNISITSSAQIPPPKLIFPEEDSLIAQWHEAQISYLRVQLPIKLDIRDAHDISASVLDDCMRIVEHTSRPAYESSSIGWHPVSKKEEMADHAMHYLTVRAANAAFAPDLPTDIVAFASFMPTEDDPPYEERAVLYIYEVHVSAALRGQGLGKWLMLCIERSAKRAGITKTMLTVFNSNQDAIKVYRKLGYRKDEASPPDRKTRRRVIKADYMIMSKMI